MKRKHCLISMVKIEEDVKMPLTSADVTGDRVARLREVFPEAFSDGRIDFRRLRESLGDVVDDGAERYGLTWAGRSEAVKAIQSMSTGTLVPVEDESVNFDTTENLIIEGDNLEVLKLLQKSYHERIKMVYIDPPYNTGNEFIYPDNFREGLQDYLRYSGQVNGEGIRLTTNTESEGRYHSKWLSMMFPRLFLAKNLLRDDGLIFVSIDDHEVHNLRLLMDELFGEENRVETFVWKKSYGGGAKEKYAVTQHEYVFLYAKNILNIDELWLPPDEEAEQKYYKYRDEKVETRGPYRLKPLEATKSMDRRDNLIFPIVAPDGTEVLPKRQWWWGQDRVLRALANNELVFTKVGEETSVSYKQYLRDEHGNKRGSKPFSVIDGIYTQRGTSDLSELFDGQAVLQFPKPLALIKKFLEMATYRETGDVVLDFFAGSGTTGQSVVSLNSEDGGNRKFLLVQLPEKTYAEDLPTIADIAKERVRRAINKLNDADSGKLPDENVASQDRGFRVFKLTSSNFRIWDGDEAPKDAEGLAAQLRLYANHVNVERSQADILYELLLKAGFPLTARVEERQVAGQTVHSIADGQLFVCLADPIALETLRGMIELKPRRVICLDLAFRGNDQLKTNIVLEMKSHGVEFRTV